MLSWGSKADSVEATGVARIAKYSEDRGHNDIAEEAYRAVAINPKSGRVGYQGLIRTNEVNTIPGLVAAIQKHWA